MNVEQFAEHVALHLRGEKIEQAGWDDACFRVDRRGTRILVEFDNGEEYALIAVHPEKAFHQNLPLDEL